MSEEVEDQYVVPGYLNNYSFYSFMLWVVFFLFFFIVLAVAFIGKVLLSNSTDITGQNAFTLIIAPTHGGHVTLFGV